MSFQSERDVKHNRKRKRCYWCFEWLEVGQPCVVHSGVWDGEFYTSRFHPECSAAVPLWWKKDGISYDDEFPEEGSMKRGSTEPKYEE